ncbi:hypothetical protein D0859_01461 [Hortaea werneckii]|uniref:Uncharacterized protein n=1 Tax=Hortaea werneckii TaxID=91943 RepID=A0A3M7JAA9_HORWE|nr:hypothetical protein D0859_01461 [Hortaea werneckii]
MGRYTELIEDVPSCNILNLADIDEFLLKFGTLSTSKTAQCVDGEQSQEDRDILAKRRGQDHGRHQGVITVEPTTVATARDNMAEIVMILTNDDPRGMKMLTETAGAA